jgi:hypothetical protein
VFGGGERATIVVDRRQGRQEARETPLQKIRENKSKCVHTWNQRGKFLREPSAAL